MVGVKLFNPTVTIFPEASDEHPFAVFVTTKLYVPGKLKDGELVVPVPPTVPLLGVQL